MASVTPLTHALLNPKNAQIRIKYPNFAIFALERASSRAPNTYNEPKRKNPPLDNPLLYTQKKFGDLQPSQKNFIHKNVPPYVLVLKSGSLYCWGIFACGGEK